MKKTRLCIRMTTALVTILAASVSSAFEAPTDGTLLFNLDATAADPQFTLLGDTVLGWGPFSLMNTNSLPPVLTEFNGVQAVRFYDTGDSHLRSHATAPAAVTGGGAYTIEAWACSTNVWATGVLLSWGNDLGAGMHSATLGYGSDASAGAVRHSSDSTINLGYVGFPSNTPPTNEWHHFVVTYSGSETGLQSEHLYVDGVLVTGQGRLALNATPDTSFHLGTLFRPSTSAFIQRFNGAIAKVRLYSKALTHSQILDNYEAEAEAFGRALSSQPANIFDGAGAWSEPSLWSQDTAATTGEQVVIMGDATVSSAQTVDALSVAGTLTLSGADALLTAEDDVYVGYGTGRLLISDGATFNAAGTNATALVIGQRNTGHIAATNATLTVTNGMFVVGYSTRSTGIADFYNTSNVFYNASIGRMNSANGSLRQTGGSFAVENTLLIGSLATGTATFEDTDITVKNEFIVGSGGGNGTLRQTGGSLTTENTWHVSSAQATGTAIFENTHVTNKGTLFVGYNANGNGTLIQRGGSLTAAGGSCAVGIGGTTSKGHLALTDTHLNVTPTFRLGVTTGSVAATNSLITCAEHIHIGGQTVNSHGTLHLTGSTFSAPGKTLFLGYQTGAYGELAMTDSCVTSTYMRIGRNLNSTGLVSLVSGEIISTSEFSVGYDGHGTLSNLTGTVVTPKIFVAHNNTNSIGHLYCASGATIECGPLEIGSGGTGVVDLHGSKLPNAQVTGQHLLLGCKGEATGTLNVFDGALCKMTYMKTGAATGGTGIINQYGGEVSDLTTEEAPLYPEGTVSSWLLSDGHASSVSTYNLFGGQFILHRKQLFVGQIGTAELCINGGSASFRNTALCLRVGNSSSSTGRVFLVSGNLEIFKVCRGNSGTGEFFFDGGVLQALSNRTDFMEGLTTVQVRSGGAIIDSNGRDITINQSRLAHDSRDGAPAKDGGLTKRGKGTLTMTGILAFTGDLGADNGTLNLASATYALPTGSGLWGGGTLIPPTGGFTVPSGSWITPGHADGTGTLTVNSNVTLNGKLHPRISADGATCGTLAVNGTLLFPADSSLTIQNPEAMIRGVSYTFLTATAISGTPAIENLPRLWSLQTSGNQIRAVYISGTLLSIK